jgi:hypothetical protein
MNDIQNTIDTFLLKNPRKRFPDKSWKMCNPEKFKASVELYKMGYCIADIAKHVGCTYDTLRKTFAREKIYKPSQYRQKHRILK